MIWVHERDDVLCELCNKVTRNYQGDTDIDAEFECEYCNKTSIIDDEVQVDE